MKDARLGTGPPPRQSPLSWASTHPSCRELQFQGWERCPGSSSGPQSLSHALVPAYLVPGVFGVHGYSHIS